MEANTTLFRSGHIVVVGVPNTGKSTLFNSLVGERLSIATPKPQTTRRTILGILTNERAQMMFVDTPGLLDPAYRLHEFMRSQIDDALEGADVVLALVDASDLTGTFTEEIRAVLGEIQLPLVVALNKIDLVSERDLEQSLQHVRASLATEHILPVSAQTGKHVLELRGLLERLLPVGPKFYPEDTLTEEPERFFVEEQIREETFLRLRQEVPYAIAVQVEHFREEGTKIYIHANIIVERDSQKGIVIGKKGSTLKTIGKNARERIERILQHPVYLDLHVKVIANWRKSDAALRRLGYRV